jgi:hypothetical protein
VFYCIVLIFYNSVQHNGNVSPKGDKGEVLLIVFRVDWNYNCHNYTRNTALHQLRAVHRTPYLLRLLKSCSLLGSGKHSVHQCAAHTLQRRFLMYKGCCYGLWKLNMAWRWETGSFWLRIVPSGVLLWKMQ